MTSSPLSTCLFNLQLPKGWSYKTQERRKYRILTINHKPTHRQHFCWTYCRPQEGDLSFFVYLTWSAFTWSCYLSWWDISKLNEAICNVCKLKVLLIICEPTNHQLLVVCIDQTKYATVLYLCILVIVQSYTPAQNHWSVWLHFHPCQWVIWWLLHYLQPLPIPSVAPLLVPPLGHPYPPLSSSWRSGRRKILLS